MLGFLFLRFYFFHADNLLAVTDYENTLDFILIVDQRDAVVGAGLFPVCGISGGAGTGKTTILKAVLGVDDRVAQ